MIPRSPQDQRTHEFPSVMLTTTARRVARETEARAKRQGEALHPACQPERQTM